MTQRLKFGWMLGSIVSIGLFAPALVRAESTPVHYEDLPRDVRRALDHERDDHKVLELWHVHHHDHGFYRAIVGFRDGEHVIRISEDGHVIARDAIDPDERTWSDTWHHAHTGIVVADRDIPRGVRHTLEHEAGHAKIKEVREFIVDDLPIYQVTVEAHDRTRVLEMLADGTYYGDGEDIREGLHTIAMADLPRGARSTILHEAGRVPLVKVFATTRHGERLFTAVAWEGHGDRRYITVTEHGDLVHEAVQHG